MKNTHYNRRYVRGDGSQSFMKMVISRLCVLLSGQCSEMLLQHKYETVNCLAFQDHNPYTHL